LPDPSYCELVDPPERGQMTEMLLGSDLGSQRAPRWASIPARILDRVAAGLAVIGLFGAMICLAGIFGFTCASVIGRHTGWFRILIADELSGYLLAGVFFLAMPYTFRKGLFVRIDFLYHRVPSRRASAAVDAGFGFLALSMSIVFSYYCWKFIEQGYDFGTRSIGTMQIRIWIPEMLMGIGMTMLCVELLAYTYSALVKATWPTVEGR
jgi:TRAP-type mannitol/chloroaromatic compound transport system permease small subunit